MSSFVTNSPERYYNPDQFYLDYKMQNCHRPFYTHGGYIAPVPMTNIQDLAYNVPHYWDQYSRYKTTEMSNTKTNTSIPVMPCDNCAYSCIDSLKTGPYSKNRSQLTPQYAGQFGAYVNMHNQFRSYAPPQFLTSTVTL